jgi:hypothetical protein
MKLGEFKAWGRVGYIDVISEGSQVEITFEDQKGQVTRRALTFEDARKCAHLLNMAADLSELEFRATEAAADAGIKAMDAAPEGEKDEAYRVAFRKVLAQHEELFEKSHPEK